MVLQCSPWTFVAKHIATNVVLSADRHAQHSAPRSEQLCFICYDQAVTDVVNWTLCRPGLYDLRWWEKMSSNSNLFEFSPWWNLHSISWSFLDLQTHPVFCLSATSMEGARGHPTGVWTCRRYSRFFWKSQLCRWNRRFFWDVFVSESN